MFPRVAASFDQLPLAQGRFDLAVFNASIHYAQDLARVLAEAARVVRPGGVIVILDSPFYPNESHGDAMVEEKHREAATRFGDRAADLMALQCIEYLTPERLATASRPMGLTWQRRRVWYPLRYELRPILSALAGNRRPSRFDLWLARRP
jgi:SAM-dependent methyltransferase